IRIISRIGPMWKKKTFGFAPMGKSWFAPELRNRPRNQDTPRSPDTTNAMNAKDVRSVRPARLPSMDEPRNGTPSIMNKNRKPANGWRVKKGKPDTANAKPTLRVYLGKSNKIAGFVALSCEASKKFPSNGGWFVLPTIFSKKPLGT
ncbi:hypothetical protein AA906_13010, partial [Geobacillus stearothermophilus]